MSKSIHIGVFIPNGAQFLDVATVDVLATMSAEYMSALPPELGRVAHLAPSTTVSYITTPSQGPEIALTASLTIKATHDYTHPDVAPGRLDIIVVPGPDPKAKFDAAALTWLRKQFETPGVDILSVCTGVYICAEAGITKGRLVSGPRGLQGELKKKFPDIKLAGDSKRWVQDGNLWSSGGVTNGNDLMAAYARSGKRWHSSVVETALMLVDVGDRGQVYQQGRGLFALSFAWQIVKTWFGGSGPSEKTSTNGAALKAD